MLQESNANKAKIAALKKINGCKWTGNVVHTNVDSCLVAINLYSSNSGSYNPRGTRIPGLPGIYLINQDGSLFCEARIIKESENQYKIEYLSNTGWDEFENLFLEILDKM